MSITYRHTVIEKVPRDTDSQTEISMQEALSGITMRSGGQGKEARLDTDAVSENTEEL